MHINEVEHRFKNARIAALGASGLSILNCYRVSQEVGYIANSVRIFSVSGLFGLMAGLLWFFMPKADTSSMQETKDETRKVLREPINVLINRVLHEQKVHLQELKNKHSPSSVSYGTNRTTGWVKPASSLTTSVTVPSTPPPTSFKPSTFVDPWSKPFATGKEVKFDDDDDLEDEDDEDYTVEDMIKESILDEELDEYWDTLDAMDREGASDY